MVERTMPAVTPPSAGAPASIEAAEAQIARIRDRLASTLTAVQGEVIALLDPETPVVRAPIATRGAVDRIAAGLRTTGQLRALAHAKTSGALGWVTVMTGLGVFLFQLTRARWRGRRKSRTRVTLT
jgi:hypothetical protein